jgi:hypothetical protein
MRYLLGFAILAAAVVLCLVLISCQSAPAPAPAPSAGATKVSLATGGVAADFGTIKTLTTQPTATLDSAHLIFGTIWTLATDGLSRVADLVTGNQKAIDDAAKATSIANGKVIIANKERDDAIANGMSAEHRAFGWAMFAGLIIAAFGVGCIVYKVTGASAVFAIGVTLCGGGFIMSQMSSAVSLTELHIFEGGVLGLAFIFLVIFAIKEGKKVMAAADAKLSTAHAALAEAVSDVKPVAASFVQPNVPFSAATTAEITKVSGAVSAAAAVAPFLDTAPASMAGAVVIHPKA